MLHVMSIDIFRTISVAQILFRLNNGFADSMTFGMLKMSEYDEGVDVIQAIRPLKGSNDQ